MAQSTCPVNIQGHILNRPMGDAEHPIKRLGDAATAVAGCAVFAYVAGWAFWVGYLGGFRAEWLVGSLSTAAILERSSMPILLLIVFAIAEWPDFLEAATAAISPLDRWKRLWLYRLGKSGVVFALLVLLGLYLFLRRLNGPAVALAALGLFVVALLISGVLQDVVQKSPGSTPLVKSLVILFLIAGILLPLALGFLMAFADRAERTSSLAYIHLKGTPLSQQSSLRLLLATEYRVFVFDTAVKTPQVRPIQWEQIDYISRPLPK
jgi:hypothetical protein